MDSKLIQNKTMIENLDIFYELSREFLKAKDEQYRRYFIENTTLSERFSIFVGQRGVGKTTLIVQYLLDYVKSDKLSHKILYIPADHFLIGKTSLYDIAKHFNLMGGEFIAFDEIHKYENWSMELKSIFDSFPHLKMIASGSSALEIHKGSHDMSRRAIVYRIAGLSFREFLELSFSIKLPALQLDEILKQHSHHAQKIIDILQTKKQKIIPQFKNYLQFGFYPYYFELNDVAKFEITVEQNIHTILESDLISIYPQLTGNSIKKIKLLLSFIAQNVPFTPHWLNIKKMLEIGDERTLKTYFKYLEDAELIQTLYKSSQKLSALDNPEKIYLHNPNLMSALARHDQNQGTLRETFFINMLSRKHQVTLPINGDFLIDKELIFEVGGKKKSFNQIGKHQTAYVASDNLEIGTGQKIPLWLFGFLY